MIRTKVVEKSQTHILYYVIFFSENCVICEICGKIFKILFTNECTLYETYKMLKLTIKISPYSLLHVSVLPDHPQGAYAEPC
jgi:hypothetical protein